ncbi:PolC-type DNA polymerase III N-terminal domain-containing protein [Streptococcus sciuri]|uniref:PolC-type DNA polymerase III N-terminal domain-containing protein n=1 Tax=Streptococcus sciuri TaxID=2973939 RepID=UPI00357157EC
MTDKFQLLMKQIGLPLELRESSDFSHARIEQVLIHRLSKIWDFTFYFDKPLPLMSYQLLKAHLINEFQKTGNQARFQIVTGAQEWEIIQSGFDDKMGVRFQNFLNCDLFIFYSDEFCGILNMFHKLLFNDGLVAFHYKSFCGSYPLQKL